MAKLTKIQTSKWRRKPALRAKIEGYRSGLEEKVAAQLKAAGHPVDVYESLTLKYTKPSKPSRYTPDWPLRNFIIVETKGRFVTADRQKHLAIKAEHPGLDIRFVFSNSNARIGKKSQTTYGMWADRYGFKYADKLIPQAWLNEPVTLERKAAFRAAFDN